MRRLGAQLGKGPTLGGAAIGGAKLIQPINTTGMHAYQIEGARFMRARKRAILADEAGTGKTLQALRALCWPALIVCPASAGPVWIDQARRWVPDMKISLIDSGFVRAPSSGAYVVSYDSLPDEPGSSLACAQIVYDEAHWSKGEDTLRFERCLRLTKKARGAWALTGSPLPSHPPDLRGICRMVGLPLFEDDDEFGRLFGLYKGSSGMRWAAEPPGAEVIRERLKPFFLRRTRREVLPALPEKIYSIVPCKVPEDLIDTLAEIDATWSTLDPLELPQFDKMTALRSALANSRIEDMLRVVNEHEASSRDGMIVFSAFVEPLKALEGRERWAIIHGETPVAERFRLTEAFQRGDLRGLGMTIGTGGVTYTLTRAKHLLFASLAYTPDTNEQAEDRAMRIGQEDNVKITLLISDHPLDYRLLDILTCKRTRKAALFTSPAEG